MKTAVRRGRVLHQSRRDILRWALMSACGIAFGARLQGSQASAKAFPDCPKKSALSPNGDPSSLKSWGAVGDGAADDTTAFIAALSNNPKGIVVVPAGTYLLNNPVMVCMFEGTLNFETGARLLFRDTNKAGVVLHHGDGAVINGYRAAWKDVPPRRIVYGAGLILQRTNRTKLSDCIIENSPGAGVLVETCREARLEHIQVSDTLADGLHFANCEDSHVVDLKTVNTGDDGLAFVNYAGGPDHRGGSARNISVKSSHTRGITVVGQSDVQISEFTVETTSASGIYCAYEASYKTRVPRNVMFSKGRIINAGTLEPRVGNPFGIAVHNAESVTFSDIETVGSFGHGLLVDAPKGEVTINGVRIKSPQNGNGATLGAAKRLTINDLTVEDTKGYGIYVAKCVEVVGRKLTVVNAARSSNLRRAIWFDDNGTVNVEGVTIIDDSAKKTIIGGAGNQEGVIKGLQQQLTSGAVEVQLRSPRLRISP